MMIRRISDEDKRSKSVHLMLSKKEKEYIEKLAAAKDMSLSFFMRQILLKGFRK